MFNSIRRLGGGVVRLIACLTVGLISAACAFAASPEAAGVFQQNSQTVVKSGLHWRPAISIQATETFLCPGPSRITIEWQYASSGGQLSTRQRLVRSVAINGNRVGEASVAALNASLKGFTSAAKITPQCIKDRFRAHLVGIKVDGATTNEYVELSIR